MSMPVPIAMKMAIMAKTALQFTKLLMITFSTFKSIHRKPYMMNFSRESASSENDLLLVSFVNDLSLAPVVTAPSSEYKWALLIKMSVSVQTSGTHIPYSNPKV